MLTTNLVLFHFLHQSPKQNQTLTFLEIFLLFVRHISARFLCDQLSTKDDVPFPSVLLSMANHQKNQKITLKLVIDTKPAFIIQSFTSIPKESIS